MVWCPCHNTPAPFPLRAFSSSLLTPFPRQTARPKLHQLAGLGALAGSRHHFMQLPARLGIRLHLPIPIVVRPRVKQCLQLATLVRRGLLNRPLDLSNLAHGTKCNAMHSGVNSATSKAASSSQKPLVSGRAGSPLPTAVCPPGLTQLPKRPKPGQAAFRPSAVSVALYYEVRRRLEALPGVSRSEERR